jgi:drug/metabolite transporter (DMT)-like permease
MKPVIVSVVALLFYALANYLIEQKFSKFNNLTIIACYSAVIFTMSSSVRLVTKASTMTLSLAGNRIVAGLIITALICLLWFALKLVVKPPTSPFDFPKGKELVGLIIVGVLFTFADYFYIMAYTLGGSLITVTSIIAMFPVVASLIKYIFIREVPNPWQIAGYVLAFCAILCIAKGESSAVIVE